VIYKMSTVAHGRVPIMVSMEMEIEAPVHSYEELCDMGRAAAGSLDLGRFLIGDITLTIQTNYGENTLSEFAKAINVPVTRVREYRTVSKFWNIQQRQKILTDNPTLTYSHLRSAMRLKDLDRAISFLDECGMNAYTVEQANVVLVERLGKKKPARMLFDYEVIIEDVYEHGDCLRLVIDIAPGGNILAVQDAMGKRDNEADYHAEKKLSHG